MAHVEPHKKVLIIYSIHVTIPKVTIFMKWGQSTGDENLVIHTSSSICAMFLLLLQYKSNISMLASYRMLKTVLHHCMCSVKKTRTEHK